MRVGEPARADTTGELLTERLVLEPLRVAHAEEMAPLLDDQRLHAFSGGRPPTLQELRTRYERQVRGRSPDASQQWLNWIARLRRDGVVVGYIQATVADDPQATAELGWTIGSDHQRQGYASEAAAAVAGWLRAQGTVRLIAHIHPGNSASQGVARSLGLEVTERSRNGETEWASPAGAQSTGR